MPSADDDNPRIVSVLKKPRFPVNKKAVRRQLSESKETPTMSMYCDIANETVDSVPVESTSESVSEEGRRSSRGCDEEERVGDGAKDNNKGRVRFRTSTKPHAAIEPGAPADVSRAPGGAAATAEAQDSPPRLIAFPSRSASAEESTMASMTSATPRGEGGIDSAAVVGVVRGEERDEEDPASAAPPPPPSTDGSAEGSSEGSAASRTTGSRWRKWLLIEDKGSANSTADGETTSTASVPGCCSSGGKRRNRWDAGLATFLAVVLVFLIIGYALNNAGKGARGEVAASTAAVGAIPEADGDDAAASLANDDSLDSDEEDGDDATVEAGADRDVEAKSRDDDEDDEPWRQPPPGDELLPAATFGAPSAAPSTDAPSSSPAPTVTSSPTSGPTARPTEGPSFNPTSVPTTPYPSEGPTNDPTRSPSKRPTLTPSLSPVTPPPVQSFYCVSDVKFVDGLGRGCDWYRPPNVGYRCATDDSKGWANEDDVTPWEACCFCGGGTFAFGFPPSPTPPPA